MDKILILGSEGFSGKAFTKYLSDKKQYEIFTLDVFKKPARKNYFSCDVSVKDTIRNVIDSIKPGYIVNFIGSFSNTHELDYKTNVIALKNLLDSIIECGFKKNIKVLTIGSAAEYGLVSPGKSGISESHPCKPVSIYGLTKAYQTQLAQYYHRVYGTSVLIARPFNLLGFNFNEKLFVGRFLSQAKQYLASKITQIELGNLESYRDYIDIKDAVIAYETILLHGKSGTVYNVGTGEPVKMHELTNLLLKNLVINSSVLISNHFSSKLNVPVSFSNVTKILKIGFKPVISLEGSVKSICSTLLDQQEKAIPD